MRDAKLMNGHHSHPSVADFVIQQVLALTYTASDMEPFARDLGYLDLNGQVLPPFAWDEVLRRRRMLALDVFFISTVWMWKPPPTSWTHFLSFASKTKRNLASIQLMT
ncbi:MAG: hypothetical protein IPI16_15690 [Comamonadaceae bacterium]|nr:hypothetical protein [Comamonadaceae bacterium]